MKCKYKFKIIGKIKPSHIYPIMARGATYEFEVNESGVATYIVVTIKTDDERYWPNISKSSTPGVAFHLNISENPLIFFVRMELRIIEGLLSLYGVHSIGLNYPQIEWIPENEEEKEKMKIFNFKTGTTELSDNEIIPTPFDIIARSIIGADKGYDVEVALSFYRKGRIDVEEKRYIEAIYNFYFLLESTYGNGKFKKRQISTEFKNSTILIESIQSVQNDPRTRILSNPKLKQEYENKYKNKSPENIIDQIIELRGFLHHHTSKRKGIWHPENQDKYKLDALFIQLISFNVAFRLSEICVFDEEVTRTYEKQFFR
ncbi:MAG: hypothetical protein GXO85_04460 [Chlorobi bacterium]|nr:hypothetical protein [Chlorobiota bacterium]